MRGDEIDALLARLAGGQPASVPIDAPLFENDFSYGSTVTRQTDGRYVLETRFKEMQVIREDEPMQVSRVILDETDLRARLRGGPRRC